MMFNKVFHRFCKVPREKRVEDLDQPNFSVKAWLDQSILTRTETRTI